MAACAFRAAGERTVFAAAGMIPFAVFLVLVAVTPVTGFFTILVTAVIIRASARITDTRIL